MKLIVDGTDLVSKLEDIVWVASNGDTIVVPTQNILELTERAIAKARKNITVEVANAATAK